VIHTEAWVLHRGPAESVPGELRLEPFSFPDIDDDEVLAEPLYGCWEGNMTHALERDPIDVCRYRGEEKVVLGNAGVVRVLQVGSAVHEHKEGDVCGLASGGKWDDAGYPRTILAYDEPGTMGVLAKRIKLRRDQLFTVPRSTKHTLQQWAAFTIRYATAWDNWKVALGAWRLQMDEAADRTVHVWAWGGGVALGELLLAKAMGCRAVMACATDARISLCERVGLEALDRRRFSGLCYDQARFKGDLAFRRQYMKVELRFLDEVHERTGGKGVSIFIDNIGAPVYRATLKALARQGVITTCGWKQGMELPVVRGRECINRHLHVFTHGARDSREAIAYAECNAWLPPLDDQVFGWEDVPELAHRYGRGEIESYFPVFRINPE
jgi:NADPH:quinone reductase-like Zn-dependent oxidoreductase